MTPEPWIIMHASNTKNQVINNQGTKHATTVKESNEQNRNIVKQLFFDGWCFLQCELTETDPGWFQSDPRSKLGHPVNIETHRARNHSSESSQRALNNINKSNKQNTNANNCRKNNFAAALPHFPQSGPSMECYQIDLNHFVSLRETCNEASSFPWNESVSEQRGIRIVLTFVNNKCSS